MQKLKDWFLSLQPRERALVTVGGILVLLAAVYLLVLAPFYQAVSASAERVEKKKGDLAWMRSVGGEVMALNASSPTAPGPSNESLVVLIDRTARECGLGASLTTVHRVFGAEIDAYLGLPEEIPSCALLPIGWPKGRYGRPARKPVDALLFTDRFDKNAIQRR